MRRARAIVGLLAVLGLLVALATHAAPPDAPRAPAGEVTEPEPRASPESPRIERAPVPTVIAPEPLAGATSRPLEAPSAPLDDPCAPAEQSEPVARPSVAAVLEARQGELAARYAVLDATASPALRDGLRAIAARDDPERAIASIAGAPDRRVEGFDHATAAAVYVALMALHERRMADARRWAIRASALDPRDPAGPVLSSIVAEETGDRAAARDALAEAFARDPEDPGIAWQLAMHLADGERIDQAVRALDAYLEAVPRDRAATRLRARLARRAGALASTTRIARRGVVVRAALGTDAAALERALAIVDEALDEASRWTRTERPSELLVIVHPDRESLRASACAPSWSGAIFDGILHTDRETIASDAMARRTLRHESLHAALHAERRTALPYWLDEGLAQRFSGEEGSDHHRSWALLVRERMIIPFPSIEGSFSEIDDPRDARLAYHQSLAIVRWLEDTHGERAIADAIARADAGTAPDALLGTIAPELDRDRLLAWLAAR